MLLLLSLLIAAAAADTMAAPGAAPDTLRTAPRDTLAAPGDSLPLMLVPGATLVAEGDGRGQVIEPGGLAVDAFGRLYVSDAALHRVQRFDRQGRWLGENGVLGSEAGEMRRPGSVALLGVLGVGVLDRENRRVQAFDLFGKLLATTLDLADPALELETGRIDPAALASDRGGALYVADTRRERVLAFDASGRFVRVVGGFGTKPGQFRGLEGLAAAPGGELVVTERLNARVQRLDAGGRVAASWALPLSGDSRSGALPVAVDEDGRVAVADESSGTLWIFGPSGRLLARAGDAGAVRALAFGEGGALMVAGVAPARVRRYALVGR